MKNKALLARGNRFQKCAAQGRILRQRKKLCQHPEDGKSLASLQHKRGQYCWKRKH